MTEHYCDACQHEIGSASTVPSMPAFTDFETAVTNPRMPSFARDTVPTVDGRTLGLRAHVPSAPLAARIAASLKPYTSPWSCSCMIPALCDGRCLVCGGSL